MNKDLHPHDEDSDVLGNLDLPAESSDVLDVTTLLNCLRALF